MKRIFKLNNLLYVVLFAILFFLCFNLYVLDNKKRKIFINANNIHVLVNNKKLTNSNIELTIKYDGDSTKDIDSYSFDGGKTWTKSNFYIVEESKDVDILIKDVLGKVYNGKYNVNNIDKEGPIIKVKKNIKVKKYSKFNIRDYITVKDELSGVDKIIEKNKIKTNKVGKKSITLVAYDKLGNKTTKKIKLNVVK